MIRQNPQPFFSPRTAWLLHELPTLACSKFYCVPNQNGTQDHEKVWNLI